MRKKKGKIEKKWLHVKKRKRRKSEPKASLLLICHHGI